MKFDELLVEKNLLAEKVKAMRVEMANKGKVFFTEHFSPLFDLHSDVHYFRWTQYTPYFNDGDECVFRSHHRDGECYTSNEEELDYEHPAHKEFRKHFPELDDDDMEAIFGDHVEVRIYKDHVEVDKCDHD